MVSCDCDLETALGAVVTALGAVVPDEADVRRVNTCSNEHIEILVHNVFELFHTHSQSVHPAANVYNSAR